MHLMPTIPTTGHRAKTAKALFARYGLPAFIAERGGPLKAADLPAHACTHCMAPVQVWGAGPTTGNQL